MFTKGKGVPGIPFSKRFPEAFDTCKSVRTTTLLWYLYDYGVRPFIWARAVDLC